jgi:hypothetical protein
MKRLFLLLIIFSIGIVTYGQPLKLDIIKDGLKVGRTNAKIISSDELKSIDSIRTDQPIQRQLDHKVSTSEPTAAATDYFYTKTQSTANFINEAGDTIEGIILVPTPSANTNSTQIVNAKYSSFNSNTQYLLKTISSSVVAKPWEITWSSGSTATTLETGVIYTLMMEPIPEGTVVTGVGYCESIAGVFTGNNFNGVALFKVVGDGTYTRVAISANDETVLKYSNVMVKVPFTAPVTLTEGLYLAALMYSTSAQTTAPTIYANSVQSTNYKIYNNTSVARIFGCIDAQTSMPSSLTVTAMTKYPTSIPVMFLYY